MPRHSRSHHRFCSKCGKKRRSNSPSKFIFHRMSGGFVSPAATNHIVELPRWAQMLSVKLYRIGVPGKGSCFFHSLYASLYPQKYLQKSPNERDDAVNKFRRKLANNVSHESWENFTHRRDIPERLRQVNVDDMKERMKIPEEWADERMIRFICDLLNLNVIFLNDVAEGMYCGVHGDNPKKQKLIIVDWVGEFHFEPVAAKRDDGRLQFLFDPENKDDRPLVAEFMKAYQDRCKYYT